MHDQLPLICDQTSLNLRCNCIILYSYPTLQHLVVYAQSRVQQQIMGTLVVLTLHFHS